MPAILIAKLQAGQGRQSAHKPRLSNRATYRQQPWRLRPLALTMACISECKACAGASRLARVLNLFWSGCEVQRLAPLLTILAPRTMTVPIRIRVYVDAALSDSAAPTNLSRFLFTRIRQNSYCLRRKGVTISNGIRTAPAPLATTVL
jgi:hypothetical protein